jgi:hypothetical protein
VVPSNPLTPRKDSLLVRSDSSNTKPIPHKDIRKNKPKQSDTTKTIPDQAAPKDQTPPILEIRFVPESIPSTNKSFPYGLRVTIQTNMTISPTHLRVITDGEIGWGDFEFWETGETSGIHSTYAANLFDFVFQSPPFTPQRSLVVTLLSVKKISVQKVMVIQ